MVVLERQVGQLEPTPNQIKAGTGNDNAPIAETEQEVRSDRRRSFRNFGFYAALTAAAIGAGGLALHKGVSLGKEISPAASSIAYHVNRQFDQRMNGYNVCIREHQADPAQCEMKRPEVTPLVQNAQAIHTKEGKAAGLILASFGLAFPAAAVGMAGIVWDGTKILDANNRIKHYKQGKKYR